MYRIHLEENEIPSSKVPQDPLILWKAFWGIESQCLLSPEAREWERILFICPLLPSLPPISLSSFSSYLPLSVSSLFLFLSIREIHQISQDTWHPEAISLKFLPLGTLELPSFKSFLRLGCSAFSLTLWDIKYPSHHFCLCFVRKISVTCNQRILTDNHIML